jgi:integrase/recombinase XerD
VIKQAFRQFQYPTVPLHADMSHKQRAIERTRPLGVKPGRYRPSDTMLAFLQAL